MKTINMSSAYAAGIRTDVGIDMLLLCFGQSDFNDNNGVRWNVRFYSRRFAVVQTQDDGMPCRQKRRQCSRVEGFREMKRRITRGREMTWCSTKITEIWRGKKR